MDKKYLLPIAIGAGVLVLGLVVAALLSSGHEEGAGGVALAAAAAAEMSRRRRAAAAAELDETAEEAENNITEAEDLREGVAAANEEIDTDVENTSLADLVDEENERKS